MRHPYEKFIRIELVAILSAAVISFIALIKGYLMLLFVCFFLISLSLLAEAMIAWSTHQKVQSIKQLIRAIIIFILTVYMILLRLS